MDQYDYIDLKPAVLDVLSVIPGWEEIPEAYRLGLTNKDFFKEREGELAGKAEELAVEADKLEAEKQTLIEQIVALQEKEEYLALAEQKIAEQQTQTRITQAPTGGQDERIAMAARYLEAMKPEVAGENLLEMPFEMGVAVLTMIETRKAAKILETVPPEQSSKYMAEISGHY